MRPSILRVVVGLICLWWNESLEFVRGATESIALTLPKRHNNTAPHAFVTASFSASASATAGVKETTTLWDATSPAAEGTGTGPASSLLSLRKRQGAAVEADATQANVDWVANNLMFFLERLEPVSLQPMVAQQMKEFVAHIASLYRADNPYHNFDHATHVSKSLTHLLLRPVENGNHPAPLDTIRSDPLLSFALVLAALIHDVDHRGIPNSQLVLEDVALAQRYQNRSVAERHSIDLGWSILGNNPDWTDLQRAIFGGEERKKRLQFWVTRAVMATDIADPGLRGDRTRRWQTVYGTANGAGADAELERTIIAVELLMQVVDVAHTMQDGQVNHEWNERLFVEFKQAFRRGRAEKDPIEGWYESEIGFFDFYVIPLALKWEKCCGFRERMGEGEQALHLFGTTSLLQQARRNRQEWEKIGHGVVAEFMEKY